jgi:hypothetical protein
MAKVGRPQLPDEERQKSLTIRMAPRLRRLVEAAAEASGRTLSQEITWRLEKSLGYEPREH